MFQFPSNGKVFPNTALVALAYVTYSFNSLQTGRSFRTGTALFSLLNAGDEFQFPSNGKVFPNPIRKWEEETEAVNVSIPFKREGLSEPPSQNDIFIFDEVSIPFKREGLSEHEMLKVADDNSEFQFPSNGKVFPNTTTRINNSPLRSVSIPFKREGLSELIAGLTSSISSPGFVSIPFKREGLSERILSSHSMEEIPAGFNSLQTGRSFRTVL